MSQAAFDADAGDGLVLTNLLGDCRQALAAAQSLRAAGKTALADLIAPEGRVDAARLETEQFAAHGFAWLATYVAALEQMLAWAELLGAIA